MEKRKYIVPQTEVILAQVEAMLVTSVYVSNGTTVDDAVMGNTYRDTGAAW